MFKIIFRIVMILLVAGVVAGGLYGLANAAGSSVSGLAAGGGRGGHQFDLASSGQAPASGRGGGGGGGGGGFGSELEGGSSSLATWLSGIGGQLGKVALITLAVVLIQQLVKLFRRRKPVNEAAAV